MQSPLLYGTLQGYVRAVTKLGGHQDCEAEAESDCVSLNLSKIQSSTFSGGTLLLYSGSTVCGSCADLRGHWRLHS